MPNKPKTTTTKKPAKAKQAKIPAKLSWWRYVGKWWKSRRIWQRVVLITIAFVFAFVGQAYAFAYW